MDGPESTSNSRALHTCVNEVDGRQGRGAISARHGGHHSTTRTKMHRHGLPSRTVATIVRQAQRASRAVADIR